MENIQRAGGLAEIERRMRDVDLKASRASSSLESLSEAMEHEVPLPHR